MDIGRSEAATNTEEHFVTSTVGSTQSEIYAEREVTLEVNQHSDDEEIQFQFNLTEEERWFFNQLS